MCTSQRSRAVVSMANGRVAHPQARVAALVVVGARAAPVLGQEQGQATLGRREVRLRVERPQDRIVGDAGVEPADEVLEEGHPAGAVVQADGRRQGRVGHGGEDSRDGPRTVLRQTHEREPGGDGCCVTRTDAADPLGRRRGRPEDRDVRQTQRRSGMAAARARDAARRAGRGRTG